MIYEWRCANCKHLLTEAQKNVLDYFKAYHKEHRIPPTYREMQENFGWKSQNSVVTHLNALVRKGKLKRLPNRRGYVPA